MNKRQPDTTSQYVNAETLLPFGDLLASIRGTDRAVHVGYYSRDKYDDRGARTHRWIAHMPDYERGSEEFLSVRISTGVSGVTHVDLERASDQLKPPKFYEWDLVVKDVVDIERTPIPYKKESAVSVECPECERFGTTHPWKLEDYLPDECECGYRGEWDVW